MSHCPPTLGKSTTTHLIFLGASKRREEKKVKMGQFHQHLLLMDPGGAQTAAADSEGMGVEPPILESLSQVSTLTKTEKKKIVANVLVQ